MTYSLDFRRKVLQIKAQEGLSYTKTSKRFGIAVNTIFLWSKEITPKGTRNKPPTKIDTDALKQDIAAYPDAYQYERAERLGCSTTGIWHAMKRLGVTYKKNAYASQMRSGKAVCVSSKH